MQSMWILTETLKFIQIFGARQTYLAITSKYGSAILHIYLTLKFCSEVNGMQNATL